MLEKLATCRKKGRIEAIYTIRRIEGITEGIALILKQTTAFTNLDVTLLVTTSRKSAMVLVVYKVGVNNDIGDFLRTTIVVRGLRRRGVYSY